jgi:5-methylcytosine-specific restriction endonuclease McrA
MPRRPDLPETPNPNKKLVNALAYRDGLPIFRRDGFQCQYCGFDGSAFEGYFFLTVDHVVPQKQKPHWRFLMDNMVTACRFCAGLKNRTRVTNADNIRAAFVEKKQLILGRRAELEQFWKNIDRTSL